MNTVSTLPFPVREIEHMSVPMPDGCRLGARIWMPENAEKDPAPAILEYIPYRKNDLTAVRDASMHPYLAGHGYAVVRLDLRGAGDSEGLLQDEYLQQEIQDGVDAVQWIAEQPWCDGNVGMVGISWGGFNGLQVAAMKPPALKAIITLCSTDDRYADDVHYMGGCLLLEQLSWASIMFGRNTLPPDPRHHGERWRSMWVERLKRSGLWLKNWLEHQTRDEFWKHGSVCEDWSKIQIPVYAVSGWADGYCRSVLRLMENLMGPKKGLIGPWAHKYPHLGEPGPAIGFLQESLRWWDHWLKGKDNGIMDEQMLCLFMQDSEKPLTQYDMRQGRWVREPSWPSPNIKLTPLFLSVTGEMDFVEGHSPDGVLQHISAVDTGMLSGKWCSYAHPGDQPADQRADDAGSLCFETMPLEMPLEIAGDGSLSLDFSVDRPVAQLAVRLVNVAPDGASTRVTFGVFNLTHRNGHESPSLLNPGKRYKATILLKPIAQRFDAGNRIRLALSTSYFPMIWPAPDPVTINIYTEGTCLNLPVRKEVHTDPKEEIFEAPESAPGLAIGRIQEPDSYWQVTHELSSSQVEMRIAYGAGTYKIPDNDLTIHNQGYETYAVPEAGLCSATGEVTWEHQMSRDDWFVRSRTWTKLSADRDNFYVEARLQAWEGDKIAHEMEWNEKIARNAV